MASQVQVKQREDEQSKEILTLLHLLRVVADQTHPACARVVFGGIITLMPMLGQELLEVRNLQQSQLSARLTSDVVPEGQECLLPSSQRCIPPASKSNTNDTRSSVCCIDGKLPVWTYEVRKLQRSSARRLTIIPFHRYREPSIQRDTLDAIHDLAIYHFTSQQSTSLVLSSVLSAYRRLLGLQLESTCFNRRRASVWPDSSRLFSTSCFRTASSLWI